ncbi:UDP-N-acetylmuramoyl-L-alanyl-D-glutamate--2,6-diaminopimelate ligase [Nocardioides dongkuii]|uniref:UDP-N-acetylmuramoyl-L-alanyl-D-glutamate--2, 6-diaminopimelate ligase n=1 Tax=Nocardioides dongkuii TaxID=2760089 RepID=UPI0015F949EF|nr:UDP-N-acetylmuramoyl-L-alanyl-D-glutamate--2,6-diaminopimelate ligase [Nocardioides dongkuii]
MTDPLTLRPQHPPRTPTADLAALLGIPSPDPGAVVTGVTLSSQRVRPGDLYAALPGARAHGAEYAAAALDAGAVAVLTDAAGAGRLPDGVPVLVVERPREVLGRVAARVYGEPARALRMIGVTGTQGKTTTTRLLEGGLQASGSRAAVIGTVGTRVDGVDLETALTTPEAPDLHGLFAVMRERGVDGCAMEVSSHALVLGRVDGVVFDVAVFLNLGRDHLDFHDTVEEYYAAKASLFTPDRARRALVNADDEHGRRLVEEVRARGDLPVRTFSATGADADWRAEDVVLEPGGSRFTLAGPDGVRVAASVPLPGDFNVANALAALAAAAEAGYGPATVAAGLARMPGVPGRLERVDAGQDFEVVVDYAHKPDAVEAALRTLRPLTTGRLLVVLGAGGDRDPGKRRIMGEIAARLADVLVVTDDNPRTEDPAAIRAELLAGAAEAAGGDAAEVLEVGDRRAAVAAALDRARDGDIVLVAGKGHETGQETQGVVHPFDDRQVVRELLGSMGKNTEVGEHRRTDERDR